MIGQSEMFLTTACSTKIPASVDTTVSFHTYRIEVRSTGQVDVYYDGVHKLTGNTYQNAGDNGSQPKILWGDGSGAAFGTSDWQYVRHNGHATGCNATTRCLRAPAGLVSWWPGDGSPEDVVGPNEGALVNGATFQPGLAGSAFLLTSSTASGMNAGFNNDMNVESMTLEAWVKPFSYPYSANKIIVKDVGSCGEGTDTQYLIAVTDTGAAHCNIGGPSHPPSSPLVGGSVPLNQWTHVACTFDGAFVRLYVNGDEVASTPRVDPIPSSTQELWIGSEERTSCTTPFPRHFDGLIDEPRLFSRALASCEIQAIVHANTSGLCKGDGDVDSIPDWGDNCVGVYNPGQQDADGDSGGDPCDCAPSDSSLLASPEELIGLHLGAGGNNSLLEWCSADATAGAATAYDLVRGALDELPVGGRASEVCIGSGIPMSSATDVVVPSTSVGFWYLVRGRNACGTGTYGFATNGTERATPACP